MALNYAHWLRDLAYAAARLRHMGREVEIAIGEPMTRAEMEEERKYYADRFGEPDFNFHPSIRRLYGAAQNINFEWTSPTWMAARRAFGGIHLQPLTTLYEADPDATSPEPWQGTWRAFDAWPGGSQVAIFFTPGSGAPRLGWQASDEPGPPQELPIQVDEYFSLALLCCGLFGWPALLSSTGQLSPDALPEALASLREIAPPADPQRFRTELERAAGG